MWGDKVEFCPLCFERSRITLLVIRTGGVLGDCPTCRISFARHDCLSSWVATSHRWLPFVDNQFTSPCSACQGRMRLLTNEADRTQPPSDAESIIGGIVILVGALALISYFDQRTPPRRRRRLPNYERLESWKRPYIYERDAGYCSYCGVFVPWGTEHIDHSVSRINGGTNHLNNLRLACSPCNLSKGALNARQFTTL